MKTATALAVALLAAPVGAQNAEPPEGFVLDPPPCRDGKAECEPWERAWPEPQPNYFDRFDPPPETLGPGPHTLVIFGGEQATRFDYRTGPDCQKARDEVLRQLEPPPAPNVVVIPGSKRAICVPR